jgi:hypothetical protein
MGEQVRIRQDRLVAPAYVQFCNQKVTEASVVEPEPELEP